MYSPVRAMVFVLNLATFALLVLVGSASLGAVSVLAVPLPLPMMIENAGYTRQPSQNMSTPSVQPPSAAVERRDLLSSIENLAAAGPALRRDVTTALGDINILNQYFDSMSQHASNFKTLAHQPASERRATYQQESANELTGFHTDLLGFQTILDQLGSDNGLANYDKSDELETLLKNMVNLNKYTLSDIDDMVYDLPGVGSTLGPIVYEIKCILDKVLDAVENFADPILHAIKPLLQPIIIQATNLVCNSGLQLDGLCLLL